MISQSGILPRKLCLKSLLSLNDLMDSLKPPRGSFVHFQVHKNSVVNVLFEKIKQATKGNKRNTMDTVHKIDKSCLKKQKKT